MWQAVSFAEYLIAVHVSKYSLTARSYVSFTVRWMNELAKIDHRFSIHFSAVALLHVARKVSKNSFSNDLLHILTVLLGSNFNQCCSVLSLHITEQKTSELVELLQKFAVEHLTTYRQLIARDFDSVATIVSTDFEALYAYKCGDYQRCLQLSTQNVHMLLYAVDMPDVFIIPESIQMLDDDICSLTAMTLIINPKCRDAGSNNTFIAPLTLSVYLMTQCQLKLHHSVTSLVYTLDYIEVAQRKRPRIHTLDHLTLKLIDRKVYMMISH